MRKAGNALRLHADHISLPEASVVITAILSDDSESRTSLHTPDAYSAAREQRSLTRVYLIETRDRQRQLVTLGTSRRVLLILTMSARYRH